MWGHYITNTNNQCYKKESYINKILTALNYRIIVSKHTHMTKKCAQAILKLIQHVQVSLLLLKFWKKDQIHLLEQKSMPQK